MPCGPFVRAAAARSRTGRASCRLRSSDQAPANIDEDKETNDDQSAGDGATQHSPRHGVSELGAEPGAAAQACREDKPQGQIELAVKDISGGRSNRHRKLKDLAQSDAGEDGKP